MNRVLTINKYNNVILFHILYFTNVLFDVNQNVQEFATKILFLSLYK